MASGVAKARADHIVISGHDGGTGASPLSSIHGAGTPWELGLSETHQTLVQNGLRDRVYLSVDGKILNGRDVIIAALLGAGEFGFSSAALITQGCIMMRKCHLNTCSVGVATQDKVLRERFDGDPAYLVNYLTFVAEEVRDYMAALGYRTFNEMVGHVERLVPRLPRDHWKSRGLDLSRLLHRPQVAFPTAYHRLREQPHDLEDQPDRLFLDRAGAAFERGEPVEIESEVRNMDRSVGAMLSGEIARRFGPDGLPDGLLDIRLRGTSGQSFGAFLMRGVSLRLEGTANDYVGKGMCGGRIVLRAPANSPYDPAFNVIAGNTCLYGATSGEAFLNGQAGERFAVRNSGATAVVEGVGDHGCEYMTGGCVVVLGEIGRNFGAGMTGGEAFVRGLPHDSKLVNSGDAEISDATDDSERLKALIRRHMEFTGSKLAASILSDWENARFAKVAPAGTLKGKGGS